MADNDDDFFAGKRPWSRIKDQILENYMSPYIAKVNKRGQPIFLIDGYAGPGEFEDGRPGSPLIMCQEAERFARGNWSAIFINNERKYYNKLNQVIQREGWSKSVTTILGDTTKLLQQLPIQIKSQSVFLYLDPFGPTGCDFALLQPFLKRDPTYSTEIFLTMNMPGMHRLATPKAVKAGRQNEEMIKGFHQQLTNVFGGDYWKDILWNDSDAEAKEHALIEAYLKRLASYLPYTRSCPVREKTSRRIKYFVVFASHHRDTLVLLNDIMIRAYFAEMHRADFVTGLWEDTDWRAMRSIDDLEDVIIDTVVKHPGEKRKFLWFRIVDRHFMRYLESEYINTVQHLVENNKLKCPTSRKTKRLNDECQLFAGNLVV
jgi:three-Cys-motif partner protein